MYDVVYLEIEFVRYRLIIEFKIIFGAFVPRTLTDSGAQRFQNSEHYRILAVSPPHDRQTDRHAAQPPRPHMNHI